MTLPIGGAYHSDKSYNSMFSHAVLTLKRGEEKSRVGNGAKKDKGHILIYRTGKV